MTIETVANTSPAAPKASACGSITRYLAPALITCVLMAGQITLRVSRELVADVSGHRDRHRSSNW